MAPLTPPEAEGLELCGRVKDFTVGALHQWPECFCKNGGPSYWVPPAFQKSPVGELQMITRLSNRVWVGTNSVPEHHEVKLATSPPYALVAMVNLNFQTMPLAYVHLVHGHLIPSWTLIFCQWTLPWAALYLPGRTHWRTQPMPCPTKPSKKYCKRKSKSKTQNRSKSISPASSTSEASLRHANQVSSPKVDLVKQDLQLSSDGSDSENPESVNIMADDVDGGSGPTKEAA